MTAARLPADDHGGTCAEVIDLSNTRRTRQLSNIEVFERVCQFLATGDVMALPPALRGEADGIMAMAVAALAGPEPPWPAGAARPRPEPGASVIELVRALAGDRADADSGLDDDGAGGAG